MSDLRIIVGDICNYTRAGQGKQPGWLAWKAKRPELFAAPPAGSEVPLHQQNRVMDVPDEPHMPWMDADFDAEEAQ